MANKLNPLTILSNGGSVERSHKKRVGDKLHKNIYKSVLEKMLKRLFKEKKNAIQRQRNNLYK
jgi:hypothetical protein